MSRGGDPPSKDSKLAAALRDNLRRRKAVPATVKPDDPDDVRAPAVDPMRR